MNDVAATPEKNHLFLVRINYKSGHLFEGWFTQFDVKANGADITSVSWKLAPDQKNRIFHLGIDNIESIIQLDYKEIE